MSTLSRLYRCASRVSRPALGLRAVLAAARILWPGARVDILLRRADRSWHTRALIPRSEPLLAVWPPPHDSRQGDAPAPGWSESLPPREVRRTDLKASAVHPGDEELAAQGYVQRLFAPVRLPGVRAALSVARREEAAFSEEDESSIRELAAVLAPTLAAEARERRAEQSLSRSRRHAERARFAQRLTAGLNKSLAVGDVFRTVVERLHRLLPFATAWLTVVSEEGTEQVVHTLRETDDFRKMESSNASGDAVDELQEPLIHGDLRDCPETDIRSSELLAQGHRSSVVLPLITRRRRVGTLGLASREPHATEGEALALLRHVSGPLAVALENARLYREAAHRSRQMTALYKVGKALSSAADRKDVTHAVLSILHETFSFQHSAVLTLETDEQGKDCLVMIASRGYSKRIAGAPLRIPIGDKGITAQAVRTGTLVYVPDVRRDARYIKGIARGRSEVAVPLLVADEVVGVLDVESTSVNAFSSEELNTFRPFATLVALALQRAKLFENVLKEAMTDGLTGLLNQRYFTEKLEREWGRSRRTGRPFSLVMVDLDDLKAINDAEGHDVGNRAIVAVGNCMRRRVRQIDAAARFGGDEFALVLSETDAAGAMEVAERMRADLAEAEVSELSQLSITAGVATWQPEMADVRELFEAADEALYRAKRAGKNRVYAAGTDRARRQNEGSKPSGPA